MMQAKPRQHVKQSKPCHRHSPSTGSLAPSSGREQHSRLACSLGQLGCVLPLPHRTQAYKESEGVYVLSPCKVCV